jgi:protein-L-isoaspartate(D-aspartate) O-methyltransferase
MSLRTIPIALASVSLLSCSKTPPEDGAAAASKMGAEAAAPPAMTAPGPAGEKAGPSAPGAVDERLDPPEAKAARAELVRRITSRGDPWENNSGPWDARVLDALRKTPRHLFMPGAGIREAYGDHPSPIGFGQTISQPTVVAIMSDALDVTGSERVLEIGTGSGYQAAVLSLLVREVFSIEIVEELGLTAKRRLAELGYRNVEVKVGDGYKGWPEKAPFDRVILTAAPPEIPQALVDQLKEGGVLVAPVGESGVQRLLRWKKEGGKLLKEDLGAVRFVPMVRGELRGEPGSSSPPR